MSGLYQTNFEAETTNVAPTGWTALGEFRTFTWSERGATAIGGTKGIFSAYSLDTGLYTGIAAQGDQAARVAFRVPGLTNAAHRSWSVLLRSNAGGSQYYRATLESNDTALRLSIYNYNAGNTLLVSSSTYSFAPAPGDIVHLEAFAVGTTISARAWVEGTPRPASISGSGTSTANYATATVSNAAYATGYAGIQLAGSPSGTWYGGDNFVVTDGAGGEDYFYPSSVDSTAPVMTGTLSSSGISATGFTVNWQAATDNVAVTGYEYSENSGTSWLDAGNVLNKSFTGKSASTGYPVQVRAYDAAGNKATPLSITVTTDAEEEGPIESGEFVTAILANNTATGWAAGTAVYWEWHQAGRIGSAPTSITRGTGTLESNGTLIITGCPPGAGYAMVAKRGASLADDDVYYQTGTVV